MPEPYFSWILRLDSAEPEKADQPLTQNKLELTSRSVQLLSVVTAGPGTEVARHSIEQSALQPDRVPRPTRPGGGSDASA